MVHISDRWVWRRWQLVKVDELEGDVLLDAIELTHDPEQLPSLGPLTVLFRDRLVPSGGGETLSQQLERWLRHEDGLCDVFQRLDEPFGVFAMFQGEDSVVASSCGLDAP